MPAWFAFVACLKSVTSPASGWRRFVMKKPTAETSNLSGSPLSERSSEPVKGQQAGREDVVRLAGAYVALVIEDSGRQFVRKQDRFAYEATIVLHHAERRLSPSEAYAALALFAERAHGRRGKFLLHVFENEPKGEIERQALEDLARFVVRRHRARRRAA